jgi:hypothetical protein
MKRFVQVSLCAVAALTITSAPALAQWESQETDSNSSSRSSTYQPTETVTPDGYGLGVNRDTYGRPHVYRSQDGTAVDPIFQNGVKRNAYGLGVHQDQFGRPVFDSAP